jgi:hypothetical protein
LFAVLHFAKLLFNVAQAICHLVYPEFNGVENPKLEVFDSGLAVDHPYDLDRHEQDADFDREERRQWYGYPQNVPGDVRSEQQKQQDYEHCRNHFVSLSGSVAANLSHNTSDGLFFFLEPSEFFGKFGYLISCHDPVSPYLCECLP